MKLLNDWRWVVRKAHSFKLAILAALLSGAEVFVQNLAPVIPAGRFAALSAAVSIAAAAARLVAQREGK